MTTPGLRLDALERWSPLRTAVIDAGSVARFSETTGDGRSYAPGEATPPLYSVVPLRPVWVDALASAVPDEVGATVPILHGEHDVRIHRPLQVGEEVGCRAAVTAIRVSPSGTRLIVKAVVFAKDGTPLHEHLLTAFLPGYTNPSSTGEAPAGFHLPKGIYERAPLATLTETTHRDQSRRYAEASGDRTVFHVSDSAARAMGFPGVIMHGMCTLAFASKGVLQAAGKGTEAVRRIAARFASPGFPGCQLITTVWDATSVAAGVVGFETRSSTGDALIRLGRVDFD